MARLTPEPVRHYRGTTVQHATYVGPAGEITVDLTKNTLVVHDNSTMGGHPLVKESRRVTAGAGITINGGTAATLANDLVITSTVVGGASVANLSNQAAAYGQALRNGTAATAARSDHYHALPAAPTVNAVPATGPSANATLTYGGTFLVPQVSQATNGQLTATARTMTMPAAGAAAVSLTDAAESRTLPTTTPNTSVQTILQTVRNGLKWLMNHLVLRDTGNIYYVRLDGNDNNDGLANTAAGALRTWNGALERLRVLNVKNTDVSVRFQAGEFDIAGCTGWPYKRVGTGSFSVTGLAGQTILRSTSAIEFAGVNIAFSDVAFDNVLSATTGASLRVTRCTATGFRAQYGGVSIR